MPRNDDSRTPGRRTFVYRNTPTAIACLAAVLLVLPTTSGGIDFMEFEAGAPIRADDINAVHRELGAATHRKRQISRVGLYCNRTARHTGDQADGEGHGYDELKSICEVACNDSPTAHLCTGHEVILSAQVGALPLGVTGFYGSGAMGIDGNMRNCEGWSNDTQPDLRGAWWNDKPDDRLCADKTEFLCCD